MASMYEKPVRVLMQDMIPALGIKPGDVFTREQAVQWFAKEYPKVKQGTVTAHLIRLSTNAQTRLHYSVKADGSDDHIFKIDSNQFRLYQPGLDPEPIYNEVAVVEDTPLKREERVSGQFAYEHNLRDYLAKNLQLIEPGLKLYTDEDINGVEYPVGGRFIDLLAVDSAGNYVVIELKVSKGYDRVVGQLLRYVNWIKLNLADQHETVRGIIIARTINEDLQLACMTVAGATLMEYELEVRIQTVPVKER